MDVLLAAALGGVAGAAITGGLTWWVARGQREHERDQAREARRQTRMERTYVDVLEHAFLIGDFVDRTEPDGLVFTDSPGPPAFPDDAALRRLNARTAVFGSVAMRETVKALSQAAHEFQVKVWELRTEQEHPTDGAQVYALRLAVSEKRKAVRDVHKRLIDLANRELDAR